MTFDPTDDSEPEMVIGQLAKIDLLEHAYLLEQLLDKFLPPAPAGIYAKHRLEPVTGSASACMQNVYEGGEHRLHPVFNLSSVLEGHAVTDNQGRIVISQRMTMDKFNHLSDTPFLPYWGIKVARVLAQEAVERRLRWKKRRGVSRHALERLIPNLTMADDSLSPNDSRYDDSRIDVQDLYNRLDDLFTPVEWQIDGFVDKCEWHYYFFEHKESLMLIKKGPDYRIHQWEQEHGHEFA